MTSKLKPNEQKTIDKYVENKEEKLAVLVTGATGFVGRHVVSNLLKKGYQVAVLVRNPAKVSELFLSEPIEVHHVDIARDKVSDNLAKFDVVIHCAWDSVNNTESLDHIESNLLIHYRFIKSLVKIGIKKVIITGSCYEYGCHYGPVSINTPTNPNTPYGLAKDMLHKSLRLLQREHVFNLTWARLFYVYGDGQNPNSIIPLFDQALARGDATFNMSLGEQLLDYLPIEQVAVKITDLIGYTPDDVFNICSGSPTSIRRLLEQRMIEKNKYIKLNLGFYEYRKNDSLAMWGHTPFSRKQSAQ